MRCLFLALFFVLAACANDSAAPMEGDAQAAFILPDDPCALVSVEEVEAATGSTVVRSGPVPDKLMHVPTAPNPCEYVTDGQHGSIVVSVHPDGAAEFTRQRDRDPVNTVAIEGVGDESFAHALASLSVRVGDGYFVLSTQLGAGWPGVRDLQDLALAALG